MRGTRLSILQSNGTFETVAADAGCRCVLHEDDRRYRRQLEEEEGEEEVTSIQAGEAGDVEKERESRDGG